MINDALFVHQKSQNALDHIESIQGVSTLEPCHKDIINAVQKFPNVSIKACHGIGKTFTMARIVLWFHSAFPNSKVLTTAPTDRQVNLLLWSEIRKGHANSNYPLGGEVQERPFWKIDDDWFALGYSPEKKSTQAGGSSFQGFHAPHMLIVFDEATGIPLPIWEQAEGMLTSGNVRFVCIGNPTTKQCEFYKCFENKLWKKLTLSCFESPNLKINGFNSKDDLNKEIDRLLSLSDEEAIHTIQSYKIKQPALITAQWVLNKAMPDSWGLDHPLFQSKVLAEFPDSEEDNLISLFEVEQAMQRERSKEKASERYIGVDPARFGTDKTIITVIEDFTVTHKKELIKKDTAYQAGEITNLVNRLDRLEHEGILVDTVGLGAGVFDQLKQNKISGRLPKSIGLKEIQFGASPADDLDQKRKRDEDKTRYYNLKAKIFDLLSKDIKEKLILLPDDIYSRQLPTIQYEFDNKGRLKIESKDDYKKRTTLSSPDEADSLAIANYGRHIKFKKPQVPRITVL